MYKHTGWLGMMCIFRDCILGKKLLIWTTFTLMLLLISMIREAFLKVITAIIAFHAFLTSSIMFLSNVLTWLIFS